MGGGGRLLEPRAGRTQRASRKTTPTQQSRPAAISQHRHIRTPTLPGHSASSHSSPSISLLSHPFNNNKSHSVKGSTHWASSRWSVHGHDGSRGGHHPSGVPAFTLAIPVHYHPRFILLAALSPDLALVILRAIGSFANLVLHIRSKKNSAGICRLMVHAQ
jgi:hypothetical protein